MKMDQKTREKLNRIIGILDGVSWAIDNHLIVECIMHVQEDLEKILEGEE